MGNAIFEQYGYNSARDLMTDLARDISDGGELLFANNPKHSALIEYGYKFDGGYWHLIYRHDRIVSIDYCARRWDLMYIMGVI